MKHLRLPIGDRERGWISYLTIDSNPNLSSQSVFVIIFVHWEARNSKPLASNTFRYLEADVRRNGRNEARREVTLPWFREEGSQPSQLGGYKIILFDHLSRDFRATKLWPKFWVDPPNSRDREPGSTRGNHFAHSFLASFQPASFQPAFIVPQLSI